MKVIGMAILGTLLAFSTASAQQGEYKSNEVAEGMDKDIHYLRHLLWKSLIDGCPEYPF